MSSVEAVVVAALDFGMARSGVSVALKSHPDSISVLSPIEDYQKLVPSKATGKVPTIILLDSKTLRLVAFGELAKTKYIEEGLDAVGQSNEKFLLLERFKMQLMQPTLPSTILAACGRPVPLKIALQETLRALSLSVIQHLCDSMTTKPQNDPKKQDLLNYVFGITSNNADTKSQNDVKKSQPLDKFSLNDVMWVITVPTLWNESAKQAMCDAATAIDLKHVKIVLESEAATVACLDTSTRGTATTIKTSLGCLKHDDFVMVMDGGGGTFDITTHFVAQLGRLANTEWHGGPWGSCQVDEALTNLLRRIFGARFIDRYETRHPKDFLALQSALETLKHEIQPEDRQENYRLMLPLSFIQATSKLITVSRNKAKRLKLNADPNGISAKFAPADPPSETTIVDLKTVDVTTVDGKTVDLKSTATVCVMDEEYDYGCMMEFEETNGKEEDTKNYVEYSSGSLLFGGGVFRSLMDDVIQPIITHLNGLKKKYQLMGRKIDAVFAVGGFCESPMLRTAIRFCFPNVQIPSDPMQSVLKGGALFALDPNRILSRTIKHTYGVGRTLRWNSDQHYPHYGICKQDTTSNPCDVLCAAEHFRVLCVEGTHVAPDHIYRIMLTPSVPDQKQICTDIYCTKPDDIHRYGIPPKFVNPVGETPRLNLLGQVVVNLGKRTPDSSSGSSGKPKDEWEKHMELAKTLGLLRKVTLEITFGAQINIHAKDETSGTTFQSRINYPQ